MPVFTDPRRRVPAFTATFPPTVNRQRGRQPPSRRRHQLAATSSCCLATALGLLVWLMASIPAATATVAAVGKLCSYSGDYCSGSESCTVLNETEAPDCVAEYRQSKSVDCLGGAPTSACHAPNQCHYKGYPKSRFQRYTCAAVPPLPYAPALSEEVYGTFWPGGSCSAGGQRHPHHTSRSKLGLCVVAGRNSAMMINKVPATFDASAYYVLERFNNPVCDRGAENPYGRRPEQRWRGVVKSNVYGGDGDCNIVADPRFSERVPEWDRRMTMTRLSQYSLATMVLTSQRPAGLAVGKYFADWTTGDVYETNRVHRVARDTCYDGRMYMGCLSSRAVHVVSFTRNVLYPYGAVINCSGSTAQQEHRAIGAGGCQANGDLDVLSPPLDVPPTNGDVKHYQQVTGCAVVGDTVEFTTQAFKDPSCAVPNRDLDRLRYTEAGTTANRGLAAAAHDSADSASSGDGADGDVDGWVVGLVVVLLLLLVAAVGAVVLLVRRPQQRAAPTLPQHAL